MVPQVVKLENMLSFWFRKNEPRNLNENIQFYYLCNSLSMMVCLALVKVHLFHCQTVTN